MRDKMLKLYLSELKEAINKNNLDEKLILEEIEDEIALYKEAGLDEIDIIKRLPSIDEIIVKYLRNNNDNLVEYELDLNAKWCDTLTISRGNVSGVILEDLEELEKCKYINITREANKLIIKSKDLFNNNKKVDINIICGTNIKLTKVKIGGVSADINLSNLDIDVLMIDTVSGDLSLVDNNVEEMALNSVSGDIDIKRGIYVDSNINVVSGDVFVKDIKVKEDLVISTISGDVNISDVEDESKLKLASVTGDLTLNKKNISSLKKVIKDKLANIKI